MSPGCVRTIWLLLLIVAVTGAAPMTAHASLPRPNALDRRVDRISPAQLLHEPATGLVDPDRQSAAARFVRWTLPGWLASILAQALLLWYFWRSGHAARLRDWLRHRLRSEWLVRFAFGAAIGLIANLASAIPDFYLYRVDRRMDITTELSRSWASAWLMNTAIAMVAVGAVIVLVLWLVERTHQWYIYTAAGIVGLSLAVAFLAPYGIPAQPDYRLPDGLSTSLQKLERDAGRPGLAVVVQRSSGGSDPASVSGLGSSQRLFLPSAMLAGETARESLFVAAHELGALAHNDPLRRALRDALLVILGSALAVFVADRVGFRRNDDELSRMALVAALLAFVYLIVTPIDLAMARSTVLADDDYAVRLTHDPASAVREISRATDQRLESVCPTLLERMFLDRLPSPGQRIARINGVADNCP